MNDEWMDDDTQILILLWILMNIKFMILNVM